MRAEIVPVEMTVPLNEAWKADADTTQTETRDLPAFLGVPSRYEGQECRVRVFTRGGLGIVYGLDRNTTSLDDSTYDMVTWVIGNVKLVFSTEEWETLKASTDRVITAGRANHHQTFLAGKNDGLLPGNGDGTVPE